MKLKFVIFLIIIGIIPFIEARTFSEEERGETLKFKYRFEEPKISSSGEYKRIGIAGLKQYRSEGEPILPCKTVKISLPHGRTYSDVRVNTYGLKSIEGSYMIEPGQSPYISQTERIPPDSKIYSSAAPYPADVFKVVTLQNKRGYRILYINLFPVRYIPSQRKLSWCSEIELEVATRPAPVAGGYRGLVKDKKLIMGQVTNPQIAESYALKAR